MNGRYYTALLQIASIFGFAGVMIGAFGAHYLKSRLEVTELDVIRTGVLYLFVHTLAMLFVILLGKGDSTSRILKGSGLLFAMGILLFSGSLFVIATASLTGLTVGGFGIITPVGGLCFMAGWVLLFIYALTKRSGQ